MSETLAQAWFRRVWNTPDATGIEDLFAPDGVAHGIHGQVIRGPKEFRAFRDGFLAVFRDLRIKVEEEFTSGDRTAIRCAADLTHAASGRRFTMSGMAVIHVANGKITEGWNCWDFLGLIEAMGLFPAGSFEMALSGRLAKHAMA